MEQGPPSPEVVIRQARRRQRRRWALGAGGLAAAVLVAGIAYGSAGNSTPGSPANSSKGSGIPTAIRTVWRSDGTMLFEHWIPDNDVEFQPTTMITCAGPEAQICYLAVRTNGILPNGQPSTRGKSGAAVTPFVSSEFRSTDAGRTWHPIVLPDNAWVSTAFSCPMQRDCAVGALVDGRQSLGKFLGTSVLLTTRDGGRTWVLHPLPASAGLVSDLVCRTVDSCVAVTSPAGSWADGMIPNNGATRVYPSEVYTTHDGGASWVALPLPKQPPGDVYTLGWVTCPSARLCIFTGQRDHVGMAPGYTSIHHVHSYVVSGTTTVVIVSTGPRSTTIELHPSGPLSCVSSTHCLMVNARIGRHEIAVSHVFASTNGGQTWSKLHAHFSRAVGTATWNTLRCLSTTSCLSVKLETNDGGNHWISTDANVVDLSCSTSGVCVGLRELRVRDPHVPPGATATVWATRVVTNAPG